MNPRPLYRWKSFWLGVLVLASLGWAWGMSYAYHSFANHGRTVVSQREGYLSAGCEWTSARNGIGHLEVKQGLYDFQLMPAPFFARGGERDPFIPWVTETRFKEAVKQTFEYSPKFYWGVFIPHWLVVTVFAVPWLAFLGWRVRKQRRSIA